MEKLKKYKIRKKFEQEIFVEGSQNFYYLYWYNNVGWTDYDSSNEYTEAEKDTMALPKDAEWIEVHKKEEDEGETN